MAHIRPTTGRLVAAIAAAVLLVAGCGKSEPETSAEVPARLASYQLEVGASSYEATMSMDGTMGFGDATRAAMGPAGASLGKDPPVSVQLSMNVTQTVADAGTGRKVTLRIDGAQGHVKAFGVDQDLDQKTLDKVQGNEIAYTMNPDGSTDSKGASPLGGLGLGMLGGTSVGGSCPRIPEGGVEPGQEWTTTQDLSVAGVQATSPSTNTYTLDGDNVTVTSRTDGPVDATIDFAEVAKSNPSLAGAGNLAGVTMRIVGTANMSSSCVLTLPSQELQSVETGGHLSMTTSLAGTAANPQLAQLGEGEFMHFDVDTASAMRRSS